MTRTTPPDPYREWDAAYVLGALSPADRRAFEAHVATCDACRDAVAELAGMPGLLGTLTAADVRPDRETAGADEDGGHAVVPLDGLVRAARRSRTRRRSLAAVAAVALVLGGTAAGLAAGGAFDPAEDPGTGSGPVAGPSPDPDPSAAGARTVALDPVDGAGVTATLTATPRPWGTSLEWSCRYPAASGTPGYGDAADATGAETVYELVLVDGDGRRSVAATWTAAGATATGLGAASATALADVVRVEITVAGRDRALAAAAL